MKPIHEHDCTACVYLGTVDNNDLYLHEQGETTVIARNGPLGEYSSGLCFVRTNPLLMEALNRAESLGYNLEQAKELNGLYRPLTVQFQNGEIKTLPALDKG